MFNIKLKFRVILYIKNFIFILNEVIGSEIFFIVD